ncbi:MAG: hypothetical protein ABIG95_06055 [Candidatus Woesearchaeota archaeon]
MELGFAAVCAELLLALFMVFNKESMASLVWVFFSLIYMFVLPGYIIGMHFSSDSGLENFVGGLCLAIGLTGLLGVLLGWMDVHVKWHAVIIPSLLVLASVAVYAIRKRYLHSSK